MRKFRCPLLLGVCLLLVVLMGEIISQPVFPPGIGHTAWFTTVKAAMTADLTEANATAFLSGTGIIQIAVIVNSGSATAGTITVYTQVLSTDTVYVAIPSATYTLTASASKVSDKITVGPGYHKLVVTSSAGTFNIDLRVRDF